MNQAKTSSVNKVPSKIDFFTIDLREISCKIYCVKSILEETLLTDEVFALFRLFLQDSNWKRQFELRNFWSSLKMAPAHCDIVVQNSSCLIK